MTPAALPKALTLVGAGRMGGALLRGWLDLGVAPAHVLVLDPQPGADLQALCADKGVSLNPPPPHRPADVLVLAVKPQMLDAAAADLAAHLAPDTLVLSIMAGKTIADIAGRLPGASSIVRSMPNTPAAVGRGVTGAAASPGVSPAQREAANALLSAVGSVVWLDSESLIDAVTAVSGSGPAYVFLLAEALAEAGEKAGLPRDVAVRLARATVEGAGELMHVDQATSPAQLRVNVTSPGGTTAAALEVLMGADGLGPLMTRAVAAAKRRAEELSG
ncbi:MAG: pyrroline-5-carboxylate reductase [Beijerinckiaceae bacterium]|nr:pyrroline-5-carboxylate reductase [Beijerinckiaceae bacterium]